MTGDDLQASWDERYQESARIWSGKVNAALVETVAGLQPGTALDLGAGEGADAFWLAEQGWQVTGVDISAVAVERAQAEAQQRGFSPDRVRFVVGDLAVWEPNQTYDLVTSSFLHSHGDFDRQAVLERAKSFVAPAGYFVVISHASFPPWAKARHEHDDHIHDETTVESELELLQLDSHQWQVQVATTHTRQATGPDGELAELDDTVIMVRRRSG